ncbi:MAG: hypothetical protein JST14_08770 [Bacteroidetes bacterium]|nr:hypothetical protein [Bacteroidota bacterium]
MKLLARICFIFISSVWWFGCASPSTVEDPAESYFIRFYGGDGNQTGVDFVVLPDKSMVLFGTTRSSAVAGNNPNSQWLVVRTDPKGMVLYERHIGGPNDEEARDIELYGNNQLVLVGNTYKSATDRDVKIVTMMADATLTPIDSAVIPVLDSVSVVTKGDEDVTSVTPTSDGFIIAGSTTYASKKPGGAVPGLADLRDGLNIRVTTNLTTYGNGWPTSQIYGKYSDDVTTKIIQVANGFYVFGYSDAKITGQSAAPRNYNYWYYGLGQTGGTIGEANTGLPSDNEFATSFSFVSTQTGDGYVLGGISTNTTTGAADLNVCKLKKTLTFDPTVDVEFQKPLSIAISSNGSSPDINTSIIASQLGGYYVLGNENGFNNNQNWVLVKLNTNASQAWSPIVFGGEGLDQCGSVLDLPDGRIGLIGTMTTGKPDVGETKMTLIKVNGDGQLK